MFYLFAAVLSVMIAFLAYKKKHAVGAKALLLLMVTISFWSLIIVFESMATTLSAKILLSQISYPAVVAAPVLFFMFVQRFAGYKEYNRMGDYLPLFIVPIIVVLLSWTNQYHGLIWSGYSPINPETNLIRYDHGWGFWLGSLGYSYVMVGLASYKLIRFILVNRSKFRSQGWLLLLGSLCPWIGSVLSILHINIAEGFDLTPGSISLSGILFLIALLNYRLLDLVPIMKETLMDNVQEGILVLDEKDEVQVLNSVAKHHLGIDTYVELGTPIQNVSIAVPELLEAVLSRKSYSSYEVDLGTHSKTFKINTIVLKTKPVSRLIVLRDITELIEKQREIQKSGKEYRNLYNVFRLMADNMPDLVWAKDLNKKYIFVNKAVCETYLQAATTEEPIGHSREDFMKRERDKHPENPDWHNIGRYSADSDEIILQTGKPGVFEEFGNIKGKFYYLDIRKAPIWDENGEMIGIVGSARDVTLQKKTEIELIAAKERAEEADRLKSSFLANMSHEVRTPMNSILGFISLMEESNPTLEEQMEYFAIVRKGGERLMNTINDIIDISRIDSGQMQLSLGETNIAELNTIVLSLFKPDAAAKNLELIFAGMQPDDHILLRTDRNKLYTVLSKLVKNAIKYTKKGSIRFGCNHDSESINYFIQDTGIGIDQKRHKDIFERFVQVDGSINRDYEGSGLGLSLCKAYIEMMGGSIWLESEEGVGSTFYFRIPLNPEDVKESSDVLGSTESTTVSHRSLHVLIVEDDPGSYEYLSLILKRSNHQVSHTYTGFEAIELCRQKNTFDLILMDVKLPGIDGYETTRRIREFSPEMQIIAISAFAFTEDHERALMAGCNDYITKPVNKDVLLKRLEQIH